MRARAIAAAKVTKLAETLDQLNLVSEVCRDYLARIPVLQIAKRMQAEHSAEFSDSAIEIIAGAIRLQVRKNTSETARKDVEFYHRSQHGHDVRKQKQGIFKLDSDSIRANAAKGGGVSGAKAALERTGMFALNKDEKRKIASEGGKASHLAMGHTPWSVKENEHFKMLVKMPDYKHQEGRNRGKIDGQRIADELNRAFHEGNTIRTARQVSVRLAKSRPKFRD